MDMLCDSDSWVTKIGMRERPGLEDFVAVLTVWSCHGREWVKKCMDYEFQALL